MVKTVDLFDLGEKIARLEWKLEGDVETIKKNARILDQLPNFGMPSTEIMEMTIDYNRSVCLVSQFRIIDMLD